LKLAFQSKDAAMVCDLALTLAVTMMLWQPQPEVVHTSAQLLQMLVTECQAALSALSSTFSSTVCAPEKLVLEATLKHASSLLRQHDSHTKSTSSSNAQMPFCIGEATVLNLGTIRVFHAT
jgi:hypothetical protein